MICCEREMLVLAPSKTRRLHKCSKCDRVVYEKDGLIFELRGSNENS